MEACVLIYLISFIFNIFYFTLHLRGNRVAYYTFPIIVTPQNLWITFDFIFYNFLLIMDGHFITFTITILLLLFYFLKLILT